MRARALQQLWLLSPEHRFGPARTDARTQDTVDTVTLVVAAHFGVSINEVRGTTRRQPTAQIRMIAMYVTRQVAKLGPVAIGDALKRDHSTIIYGVEQIEAALQFDPFLRRSVAACVEKATAALGRLDAQAATSTT